MSEHDRGEPRGTGAAPTAHQGPLSVSRRTLVKTAVGAGVAVAVAGSVGIAHAGTKATNTLAGGAPLATNVAANAATHSGPVVVHVMNAHTGTLEVFGNGTRTPIHDADLAARIGRVASAGPVVVHVIDAGNGSLEVFSNGTSTQIRNQDLANRIVRAV